MAVRPKPPKKHPKPHADKREDAKLVITGKTEKSEKFPSKAAKAKDMKMDRA